MTQYEEMSQRLAIKEQQYHDLMELALIAGHETNNLERIMQRLDELLKEIHSEQKALLALDIEADQETEAGSV